MDCGPNCPFDTQRTAEHLLHHLRKRIPTLIPYQLINLLPQRADFTDDVLGKITRNSIAKGAPLLFMPLSVQEKLLEYRGGNAVTHEYLFGILPCGSKACVILEGGDYRVEVMVPDGMDAEKFTLVVRGHIRAKEVTIKEIHTTDLYHAHGFQKAPRKWVVISFYSLIERTKFLKSLPKGRDAWETASDDNNVFSTFYYQKMARERRFASAGWNFLLNYVTVSGSDKKSTNCDYEFRVNVAAFRRPTKDELKIISAREHPFSRIITREPILTASWDIETRGENPNGAPTVDDKYTIPTICTSYQWYSDANPLLRVAVSMYDCVARPGIDLTITCGGVEKNTLLAHMEVMSKMAPDILQAFNGGHFDWPLYRKKVKDNGLLTTLKSKLSSTPLRGGRNPDTEESVEKWSFTKEKIKINAENDHHMERAAFDGMIDTDTLPIFLKLYPKAEIRKFESLNFFLKSNELELKEDMPIKRMLKIFDRAAALVGKSACHCDTAHDCKLCCEKIPELDCIPAGGGSLSDTTYTTQWLPEYLGEDGRVRCCYCSKRPKSRRDIAEVNYYCVVDCVQPHKLCVKRTIFAEAKALATMSYTSLFDAIYRADGMKVYNLIASHFYKRGIAFSNSRVEAAAETKEHFPGAFVFPPNRGLHADGFVEVPVYDIGWNVVGMRRQRARPITGLDFNSLYPSIMMNANISTETKVKDPAVAEQLRAEGYDLHPIGPYEYEIGEKKGAAGNKKCTSRAWTVRHNGVLKGGNIVTGYKKIIKLAWTKEKTAEFEESVPPEVDTSGAARSVEYRPVYGREAKPGERMGTFAYIVMKLFNKRVPIKREFLRYEKILEDMNVKKEHEREITLSDGSKKVCNVEEIEFLKNVIDVQQKAIKVLANTFYGKSGDRRGKLYDVDIAAGITTDGQRLIKFVAKFVTERGFTVHYGDTDSLYLSCPDSEFAAVDAEYSAAMEQIRAEFAGVSVVDVPAAGTREAEFKAARIAVRKIWWTKQVEISMRVMKKLQEDVFDHLLRENGTLFLKMAIEEVGFPTYLCGNKKYFLVPHVDAVDFYPKKLMIRGIDVVKQGQTAVAKDFGNGFMKRVTSVEFEGDPLAVAEEYVRKFYGMRPNIAEFALKARYKPDKNNVPVHRFVARMKALKERFAGDYDKMSLYEPPEGGDKFDYVIVKKSQEYDLRGRMIPIGKGDQMEYLRVYVASQSGENPLQIDTGYYMERAIAGILARFIVYCKQFQPPGGTPDKDGYKDYDKKCVATAKKYLIEYGESLSGPRIDYAAVGRRYQKVYRKVEKAVKVGDVATVLETPEDIKGYLAGMRENARAVARGGESVSRLVKLLRERCGMDIFAVRSHYVGNRSNRGVLTERISHFDVEIAAIEAEIIKIATPLNGILRDYEAEMAEFISRARGMNDEEIAGELAEFKIEADESAVKAARELQSLTCRFQALVACREEALAMGLQIVEMHAKAVGIARPPDADAANAFINSPIKQ